MTAMCHNRTSGRHRSHRISVCEEMRRHGNTPAAAMPVAEPCALEFLASRPHRARWYPSSRHKQLEEIRVIAHNQGMAPSATRSGTTDDNRAKLSFPVKTATGTSLDAQQVSNDRRICEIAGCDLPDKPPLPHDDKAPSDSRHQLQVLFDQQYPQVLPGRQIMEMFGDLIDDGRLDPFARLVEQNNLRTAQQASR